MSFANGLFIAIGGPSGVGKSTIIEKLRNYFGAKICESIAYTTRPPRKDEINGVHYFFVKISELTKYQNNPRYTNFVSARGHWYWIDLVNIINELQLKDYGIYLTAITQVPEFIERKKIFPKLHWIWLTAQKDKLYLRLKGRGDDNIEKSQKYNEFLENQNRSKIISLEIDTSTATPELVLNQIINFIKKLGEKKS